MMTGLFVAYAIVAALLLFVSLASTPRPRSVALILVAVALWPLTMAAITLQAYVSTYRQRSGARISRTAASSHPATSTMPAHG